MIPASRRRLKTTRFIKRDGQFIDNTINFISRWRTDNPGVSNNNQIKLPLQSTGTYNFIVDWGDGNQDTITQWDQAETTHTYSTIGSYQINITGTIRGWRFNFGGDKDKLLEISSWGSLRLGNSGSYFAGCTNLNVTSKLSPNLTGTTLLLQAFRDCPNLKKIGETWDVSNVTNFAQIFFGCSVFNQDIGDWDMSSATNISEMFHFCDLFNHNLNSWDVSNVSTMLSTFRFALAFNGDISSWNTVNVTQMTNMFQEANAFNQDISNWNVSNVTLMNQMFLGAESFNQDISNWNTQNVTNMNNMFKDALAFNQDISSWNVGNVTNMNDMFNNAQSFDQNLGSWDITSVTNMSTMFSLVTLSTPNYNGILTGWEAQAVQNNVNFNGGNSQYSAGAPATARAALINDHSWTITDGGQA